MSTVPVFKVAFATQPGAAQMARFNIDVRAPMSLAQAFAICISNRGIADIMK